MPPANVDDLDRAQHDLEKQFYSQGKEIAVIKAEIVVLKANDLEHTRQLKELNDNLTTLIAFINQFKGGSRALAAAGAFVVALVGAASAVVGWFFGKH